MAVQPNQQTSATAGGTEAAAPTDPSVAFEAAVMADLGETTTKQTRQTDRRGAKAAKHYDPDDPDQPDPEDEAGTDDEEIPEEETDDTEEEIPEEETDDTEEESDESEEETDEADEADEEDEKSYAKLPKWVQKRLSSQGRQLKELKAAAAKMVTIAPTATAPLADVETEQDLQTRLSVARQIKEWVRRNPYGGTIRGDNGDVEISEEMAQEKLQYAEAVLDAAPDAQRRLQIRSTTKPWEQAEAICPNLFKEGSEEHAFAMTALQKCPAIKTSLDNWEMFIAAAVRGLKEAADESSGKARYVRVPVKGGKVVGPSAAQSVKPGTKPASTGAKPVAVKGAPPLGKSGGKPNIEALAAKARESRDPEDFAALVRAELAD